MCVDVSFSVADVCCSLVSVMMALLVQMIISECSSISLFSACLSLVDDSDVGIATTSVCN